MNAGRNLTDKPLNGAVNFLIYYVCISLARINHLLDSRPQVTSLSMQFHSEGRRGGIRASETKPEMDYENVRASRSASVDCLG